MIRPIQASVAGVLVATTLLFAWGSQARAAATPTDAEPPPPPTTAETTEYEGPNRALIGTGFFLFGASYIPVAVIAGTSAHQGDSHLYVPVAGPWLDMADRGPCNPRTAACDNEMSNKVGLAVSGVFQGLGVLCVMSGFIFPEERTVTTMAAHKPSVHFRLARLGRGGYGISAFGEF
jgi:hypothetical protein